MTEFNYPWVSVERIVDGDTIDLHIDLGFEIGYNTCIRLSEVDTAEIYGPSSDKEYEQGMIHKRFVEDWVLRAVDEYGSREAFELTTTEYNPRGKYGRVIGDIVRKCDGESLVEALKDEFEL